MIASNASRSLTKAATRVAKQHRASMSSAVTVGELMEEIQYERMARNVPAWTDKLSFTSPDADFTTYGLESASPIEWSDNLSFSSPESDFTAQNVANAPPVEWSNTLSFASPESDFTYREKQTETLLFSALSGPVIVKGN